MTAPLMARQRRRVEERMMRRRGKERRNREEKKRGEAVTVPAMARRHTLSILGASDVTVIGGTYLEAGGDGIYVDRGGLSNYSHNVLLRGVTTDRAWRNGLSVISAINLTVEDAIFKRTNGTNPQCGIGGCLIGIQ